LYFIYNIINNKNKDISLNQEDEYINKINIDKLLKNELNDKGKFNKWFNDKFEKYASHIVNNHGYDDWMKSEENFINIPPTNKSNNINEMFEELKNNNSIIIYQNVNDHLLSSSYGSPLIDDDYEINYTSNNYTDLKQAYTETYITVSNKDYLNIKNNIFMSMCKA